MYCKGTKYIPLLKYIKYYNYVIKYIVIASSIRCEQTTIGHFKDAAEDIMQVILMSNIKSGGRVCKQAIREPVKYY